MPDSPPSALIQHIVCNKRIQSLMILVRVCVCDGGFFFSSRRRHTRFDCDWSSDVCSSDLRPGTTSAPTSLLSSAGSKATDVEVKDKGTEARNRAAKEERLGEAEDDASDKNTNSRTTQPAGKAYGEAPYCQTGEAGASGARGRGSSGAGALQAVQAGLGGDRGAHSECARHAVCLPVLPEVASRSGTCARV